MRWNAVLLAATIFVFLAAKTLGHSHPRRANLPSAVGSDTSPVVLELFTSEGCSSCPPADALLKQLDDAGRQDDVEIIAIEEHVDYWNRLGWTDQFSSHAWTERQEHYARVFGLNGVYTPQLVVDGRKEFVGSSTREARQSILEAARFSRAQLRVFVTGVSAQSAELSIAIEKTPPEANSAELWLAVTERGLSSNVLRGENEGRNLAHAAVLRSLARVRIQRTSSASAVADAKIPLAPAWKRENLRFVVFLQEPKSLRIFGAAASSARHE